VQLEQPPAQWTLSGGVSVEIGGEQVSSNGANARLAAISLNPGCLSTVFSPDTLNYIVLVGNDVTSITLTPTLEDNEASLNVTAAHLSGTASRPTIGLDQGENTVTVQVTARDGLTKRTYTIIITRASLQSISITHAANKLIYTVGDALDISGLQVTGTYSNNSTTTETISVANISGFNSSTTAASQTLTITIGGKTTTYTIVINPVPVVLQSIAITQLASKLVYTVGEQLDITGLQVTGTYSNNSTTTETISVANISGFNSSAPATSQTLTITVGGKTVTYTIMINTVPVVLQSIAITQAAGKLVYTVGEQLDITGLQVTGTYSDNSTKLETVTRDSISGFNSSVPASSQTLTITVGGKTATYTIVINAVPVVLESIAITHTAGKLSYTVGDALDITGLVVTGTYSNNTTSIETITVANITGFNSSVPASSQTLTITVGGKTATYTIEIKAQTYTVTFKDWDQTVLKTETVKEGENATAPANPTRAGYSFSSWDQAFTNITSDLTVTAQYSQLTYTVTFKDWDGTILKSETVNHGSQATTPDNPVRTGYTFTGWDNMFDNVTSELTVTAQYKSSNAKLSTLSLTGNSLTDEFTPDTLGYSANVTARTTSVTLTVAAQESDSMINVSGDSVKISANTYQLQLASLNESDPSLAENRFDIGVTAPDGVNTKLYTITVIRGPLVYESVRQFGSSLLNQPAGIASDAAGNIYVADTNNNRIVKYDQAGTYKAAWGINGNNPGQFRYPTGVAVDSQGNIYVVDRGNDRIQKLAGNGSFITQWGGSGNGNGKLSIPFAIAIDSNDNVYVTDSGNNRIQKFGSTGVFKTKWSIAGVGQSNPVDGITVDKQGNVYMADNNNHRILKFAPAATSDTIYTCVEKWGVEDENGSVAGSGDGEFNYPAGLACDNYGNIYVADTNNNRVQKLNHGGGFINAWVSPPGATNDMPLGIAVDGQDNVFVSYSSATETYRVEEFRLSDVNGSAPLLSEGTNYAKPVPGSTADTVIITSLNLVSGASKWQVDVQEEALTSPPALDSVLGMVSIDSYTTGDDIPLNGNSHLYLYATDTDGHVKAYADIIVTSPLPQGMIYSQDGFGFNGVITAHPLGENITMLANKGWANAGGKNCFGSGVFDGLNLWLLPRDDYHDTDFDGDIDSDDVTIDRLVKVDKNSGNMTRFNLPGALSDYGYRGAVFDGKNLWLSPAFGDFNNDGKVDSQVSILDPADNTLTRLDGMTDFANVENAFCGAAFDGQRIWLAPYGAGYVVSIDKDNHQIKSYRDDNLKDETLAGDVPLDWSNQGNFNGAVFDGEYIWLIPHFADKLVRVDQNGNMKAYKLPNPQQYGNFRGGTFDGKKIWLAPFNPALPPTAFDTATGEFTTYDWPDDFVYGVRQDPFPCSGAVFDGQSVWLIPSDANMLVRFDKDSSEGSAGTGYSTALAGVAENSDCKFAGGVFDGDYLWLIPEYSGDLVRISTASVISGDTLSATSIDLASGNLRSGETASSADAYDASCSADGSKIAFNTITSNGNGGFINCLYVKDADTGAFTKISEYESDAEVYSYLYEPPISDDGRYVIFCSPDTNLDGGATPAQPDFTISPVDYVWYVRDLVNKTTTRLSAAASESLQYVAYYAGNDPQQVYVRNLQTGITEMASVKPKPDGDPVTDGFSHEADVTPDGRYVVFTSNSQQLVSGDSIECDKVFLRDMVNETTEILNVDASEQPINIQSYDAKVSDDGRYVAFVTFNNGTSHIIQRDRKLGVSKELLTLGSDLDITMSGDGRYIAFPSLDSGLVPGDDNVMYDVFVYDSWAGVTRRLSVDQSGNEAGYTSNECSISADGQWVVLRSQAALAGGQPTEWYEIYRAPVPQSDTKAPELKSVIAESAQIIVLEFDRYIFNHTGSMEALIANTAISRQAGPFNALTAGDSVIIDGNKLIIELAIPLTSPACSIRIAPNTLEDYFKNVVTVTLQDGEEESEYNSGYQKGYLDGYLGYGFQNNNGSVEYRNGYQAAYSNSLYDLGFNNGFWDRQNEMTPASSTGNTMYDNGYNNGFNPIVGETKKTWNYGGNTTWNYGAGFIKGQNDATAEKSYSGNIGNQAYKDGYHAGWVSSGRANFMSGDATLTSLTVLYDDTTPIDLLTADNLDVREFTQEVDETKYQVLIGAETGDSNAHFMVYLNDLNHPVPSSLVQLAPGTNRILVVVTAEDGSTTESYVVNIYRDGTGVTCSTAIKTSPAEGYNEMAEMEIAGGGTTAGVITIKITDKDITNPLSIPVTIDDLTIGSKPAVATAIINALSADSILCNYYQAEPYFNVNEMVQWYFFRLRSYNMENRNLSIVYTDTGDTGITTGQYYYGHGRAPVCQVDELNIKTGATIRGGELNLRIEDGVLTSPNTIKITVAKNEPAASVAAQIAAGFSVLLLDDDYMVANTPGTSVVTFSRNSLDYGRTFRVYFDESPVTSSCVDVRQIIERLSESGYYTVGYLESSDLVVGSLLDTLSSYTAIDGSSPTFAFMSGGQILANDELVSNGDILVVNSEEGINHQEYTIILQHEC